MIRFWSKVDRRGPDECWPWLASANRDGYGHFRLNGKMERAHRVAFFLTHGRWPEPFGLHSCDNPPCCNPAHVREGDNAANMRDAATRGRTARQSGTRNGRARLSKRQVRRLRRLGGTASQAALATQFGIAQQSVSRILSGKRWVE